MGIWSDYSSHPIELSLDRLLYIPPQRGIKTVQIYLVLQLAFVIANESVLFIPSTKFYR
jgi:hypothetical protein